MTSRATSRTRPTRLGVSVVGTRLPPAASGLGAWLQKAAPRRAAGLVTIALVSDREMTRLNGAFRGKPEATDVLSFPDEASTPVRKLQISRYLGDIAIARGVAARQARREGHALRTELRVLALHGLLHLLGYDHEQDHGEMRVLEERLRRRAGLPAGLIARAPGRTTRR